MNSILLIINILLLLYKYESIQVSSSSSFENHFIDPINDLYDNNFTSNIYLPEYQNKFSRINELNDSNFNFNKIKNNRSVVLVPDKIIAKNEKLLEIENVAKLINKIENNDNNNTPNKKITKNKKEIYPDDYSFYGSTNILSNDYNYKYIKKNSLIYDKGSSLIDIISTDPEEIKLEYEICKPKNILFKIFNKNSDENLIIKDIKTDLYQVKIFPYVSNKNNNDEISPKNLIPNIDSYLEHSIYPRTIFVFQLLFVLDYKTRIKGTLYIEFNDKKVLLIPITIIGMRNMYSIEPVYRINFQATKKFEEYVKFVNPTSKTIHIKEIIHSFEKIKVFWANGDNFYNNNINFMNNINTTNSSVNNSLITIEPITDKKLLILKYNAKNLDSEYGFIHIRTDEGVYVIPVLLNFINSPIIPEPKLINFGICDITPKSRDNFIRIIPFKLTNDGEEYIRIGKVYINYDELFLQFHQNFGGNNIVIKPNEKIIFGYFIFNANIDDKKIKRINDTYNIPKVIYIETNNTQTPLVEIYYTYIPYMNNELQEVTENIQKRPKNNEPFSFYLNVKFKKGIKLRQYNSYLPGENITIRDRYMIAKVKNPSNEYQSTNSKIYIEIDKLSEIKSLHYFYLFLLLKDMQYTIIPIQVDNDDLIKIYCGDEDNSKSLAICEKNTKPENEINTIKNTHNKKRPFIIDFEQVPEGTKKKKFIFLINQNESPIEIRDIVINISSMNFLVDFEGYEYFGNKEQPSDIKYPHKGLILEQLKEKYRNNKNRSKKISFIIYANTAVKLSINLFCEGINSNITLKNEITFYYSDNYSFILSLNASILPGQLYFPQKKFNYEPSFPGLYQTKIIEAKNEYNFPIKILSVNSSDKRINATIMTNVIYPNNKARIISALFSPSKSSEFKEYEMNMSNILTYRELYLWKIEDKYFDKLEASGQSTINANLSIKTSINTEYVNFNALLIKPNLVKKEKISIGLVQINKPVNIYIEGINPSDKIVSISLRLAEESFSDIHNNNMFNEKDKMLLENNNDFIIFGCNFLLRKNASSVIEYEYITIPEKMDPSELRRSSFDKKELVRLLYKYGNEKVKSYLFKAENILCKYSKKKQHEILFSKNNEYNYIISQTYSKEFNNEIISVKNMTNKDIEYTQYKPVEKKSFFQSLVSYLFNLYLKYFMHMFLYSNINIVENPQSFFIPKDIRNNIYQIPPHQTFSIGPIIFKPNKSGIIRSTLFLKNNLTVLYPLKLEGEGGGGIIRFFDYYRGINKKKCRIYNEKNLLIDIDEEIYNTELKNNGDKINRTVTLMNVGNLPLVIKNITIDNGNECKSNNIRIIQCKEISISPKEMINIDIEINPNYGKSALNKIIQFNSEYQSFYLNVFIILSDELYEKKNFVWIYLKCFSVVFVIVSVMMYSINKIISLIQKQRKEMCDKEAIKEDVLNEKEEKETMLIKEENKQINLNKKNNGNNKAVNNKQNKGKKKKRKRSVPKGEIEIKNNKAESIKKDNSDDNKKEKVVNKEEKGKEKEIKNDINIIKEEVKEIVKEVSEEKKEEDIKENNKENKNVVVNVSKNKKRRIKSSASLKKSEDEKKVKKNNNEENISEDKKEKEPKKYNNNVNDIYENYNYNYKNNQNKYRKGKNIMNRKYYYSNYQGNRKYNNNYYNYYENNISNNNYNNNYINNNYNNNYINNNYNNTYIYNFNNNYNYNNINNNNNAQQAQAQTKKTITKITIEEKKVKNLRELIESEETENNSKNKNKSNKKNEKIKNENNVININNDINNIKISNKENNDNISEKNISSNKKQEDIFDNDFSFNKKIKQGEKSEEMNPIFLADEKFNNDFDFEQDLIKSLKKENKNLKEEIPKVEDFDYNDSDQFNFNCFFFDKNPSQEEEGEFTGNYEDYKYKSIIDNLNGEFPFSEGESKENVNNNSINNNEDKKEENEENLNNKKFGINFNFMNFDNNN